MAIATVRAVSLFSNCGAGDFGYREAGFRFDVMAELDPRRLAVALANHPEAVGVVGDLRVTWPDVVSAYRQRAGNVRPSLLCACPPCQGMSSARAGKGRHDDPEAGSKDSRNLLVTVIVAVARALLPALIVVENVPAFLSRRVNHPVDGWPVSAANYLLSELAEEYEGFPFSGDLAEFGVPQSRKRAFITLVRRDIPGLRRMKALREVPLPRVSHGKGLKPLVTLAQALEKFKLPPLDASTSQKACNEKHAGLHTVPVWSEATYAMVARIPSSSGLSAWENDACPSCGQICERSMASCATCSARLLRPVIVDKTGTVRLIRGFPSSYRRMYPNKPASTITTASGHVGSDYTIHPTENRLLSPLECALLQTIPRTFNWGETLSMHGHTLLREMIGEAVPPAFTSLHGKVLWSLLTSSREARRAEMTDPRFRQARARLLKVARQDERPCSGLTQI